MEARNLLDELLPPKLDVFITLKILPHELRLQQIPYFLGALKDPSFF